MSFENKLELYLFSHFIYIFKTYKHRKEKLILQQYAYENSTYILSGSLFQFLLLFFGVMMLSVYDQEMLSTFGKIIFGLLCFFLLYYILILIRVKSDSNKYNKYVWEEIRNNLNSDKLRHDEERHLHWDNIKDETRKYQEAYFKNKEYRKHEEDGSEEELKYCLVTLELSPYVRDLKTIKKQYRQLMKKYHPDVFEGKEDKAKEIIHAYERVHKMINGNNN